MKNLKIALILLALSPYALAYIDPGSAVFAWQGLLALIGGIVVFVRSPFASIKKLILAIFKKNENK
ncbi:hypothetical protein [Chromobacterium paludis]|uniref:Uncharacterized protein n=1 Tax=Chromobacterium paludis TaxID=2605945 RepID=A0A5C1DE10_9NEIS|nr:hypothetical protein [Chromobacterium paludis]QEL54995.1 hypothetical protein FYK34_05155 [Chromobacterium paludis]